MILFCVKQKTAYEMRISDWSSDVCSSDLYLAVREDPILLLRLLVGEGHRPALPLRPAHEAGLEGFSADLADLGVPGVRLSDADEVFMSNIAHLVRTFTKSEEHTSELQSLMRNSYAVFCLKKKKTTITQRYDSTTTGTATPMNSRYNV